MAATGRILTMRLSQMPRKWAAGAPRLPNSLRSSSATCIMTPNQPLISAAASGRWSVPSYPRRRRREVQRSSCYHELAYQRTGPAVSDVLRYRQWGKDVVGATSLPPHPAFSSLEPPPKTNIEEDGAPASGSSSSWSLARVKMLYAPWNPADTNAVQGLYPLPSSPQVLQVRQSPASSEGSDNGSPPSFTVAGSEGLGQVTMVLSSPEASRSSSSAPPLRVGDYVTLAYPSMGTMRSSLVVPDRMLIRVDRGQELVRHASITSPLQGDDDYGGDPPEAAAAAAASCLFQMGGTALRMLSDFVPVLQEGEGAGRLLPSRVVVQNAGNSAVGFMVSQIAAIHGAPAVSLIRRGTRSPSQVDDLVRYLKEVGRNAIVAVEEDLHQDKEAIRSLRDSLRQLSNAGSLPLLALNSVGGSSCSLLFKLLGNGGGGNDGGGGATLVTYGGMSRKPVPVSTAQLIFDDVTVRGYWQSRWMSQQKSRAAKHQLVNHLVDLVLDRGLKCPPVQVFPLADFTKALQFEADQSSQSVRRKVVFNCRED